MVEGIMRVFWVLEASEILMRMDLINNSELHIHLIQMSNIIIQDLS